MIKVIKKQIIKTIANIPNQGFLTHPAVDVTAVLADPFSFPVLGIDTGFNSSLGFFISEDVESSARGGAVDRRDNRRAHREGRSGRKAGDGQKQKGKDGLHGSNVEFGRLKNAVCFIVKQSAVLF